jgi:hypothetical protein
MMKTWKNSKMDTFYGSNDAADMSERCIVTLGDGRMTLKYDIDGGVEVYEGTETAQGHFNLASQDGLGKASLHCFPGGSIFDGWWTEEGDEGMWRIRLGD